MIANITNYFTNLNNAGQALFIVGVLLIITFIVLLVVVFKPDRNKVKKIYGESPITDSERILEEKMKDIDNISINDINIENDRTRNLKSIVDELKQIETKTTPTVMDRIEAYEDEQEDTAIISVEELLKSNKPVTYERRNLDATQVFNKPLVKPKVKPEKKIIEDDFYMEDVSEDTRKMPKIVEEKKYTPRREIFSSVYAEPTKTKSDDNNEAFLNSLKEFRSNL